ncbi:phosphatase PAP2 family protein [Labrys sp. 22185]|uniref:phosphatase PAP2 family protein n=1 Tax=Labrys sp. 22185 TaxID=3453888 RepID=UPI003F84F22B
MRNAIRQWSHTQNWRALGQRLRAPARLPARPLFGRVATPAAIAFGSVLVIALMVLADPASLHILPEWPHLVVRLARFVTYLGDSGLYLIPLGVALVLLAVVDLELPPRLDAALRQLWLQLAFAFVAIAGTGLAVNVIKRAIGRVRPLHVEAGASWSFEPFSWRAANASFPSGHATTAWTVAAVIILLCGARWRPWLFVLGGLVCLSRVILGAHYPADVVAGALFGWFATFWFADFLGRRGLVFRQNRDGALALRGQDAAKTLIEAWRARR